MRGSMPDEDLPEAKEIALLLARFACNNHTVTDEEATPIGVPFQMLYASWRQCWRQLCQSLLLTILNIKCMHDHLEAGVGFRGCIRNHNSNIWILIC